MKISNRLKSIAGLITEKDVIADIGCDHAYLDIYLVKNKIVFILSSKLYFFIFDMALFKHEALLSLATQRTFLYLVKYISRSPWSHPTSTILELSLTKEAIVLSLAEIFIIHPYNLLIFLNEMDVSIFLKL